MPWHRLASTNARRILLICAVLGGILTLGIYRAMTPAAVAPHLLSQRSADPVGRFTETRVGHLLVSKDGGESCRRLLFDNRTGEFMEGGQTSCDPASARAQSGAGDDRMQQIRRSFQK
jgi:hypothetical protein